VLDYSIKLPKNRRLHTVGFYVVLKFFLSNCKLFVRKIALKNDFKRYIMLLIMD
jgi:hypothetical protein